LFTENEWSAAARARSLPFVSIVRITGHGDMSTGVRAMREGAADCLQKPIDDQTLLQAAARAARHYFSFSISPGRLFGWKSPSRRRTRFH
jgi:DNA-binding NtrC family response regulator